MRALFLIILVFTFIALISAKKVKKPKEVKEPKTTLKEKLVDETPKRQDPCANHKCTHGRECVIDSESQEAKCQCIRECTENTDPRRRVCSNFNTTWQSDCHLHRHRCLCTDGLSEDCTDDHKHMHIDYYGECQDIPACQKEILEDFPRRMREWLYTIMTEDASKGENLAGQWVDAVIWKFCDLDKQPHDRFVSRHELFPLRAPLLSMEPCISEFLNKCDPDSDHKITLGEWEKCLGAPEGELADKCSEFRALQLIDAPEQNDV